jgi:hypothetical protein
MILFFKYHLAKQVQDGKPITDELAFALDKEYR